MTVPTTAIKRNTFPLRVLLRQRMSYAAKKIAIWAKSFESFKLSIGSRESTAEVSEATIKATKVHQILGIPGRCFVWIHLQTQHTTNPAAAHCAIDIENRSAAEKIKRKTIPALSQLLTIFAEITSGIQMLLS